MADSNKSMFYVYFIQSLTNSKIYVGRTAKNPEVRLKEHNSGSNDWSKNNGPFKLVYYERYHCIQDVINRENFYKKGFGKEIKKLIIEYINKNKIKISINN